MNNTSLIKNLLQHYQNKKFDKAEELALEMTVKSSDNPLPWKVLGAIFGQTGRKSKAIEANQKAIQLAPKDPQAHNNLGIALQEQNRLNEAEASFRQSILLKDDFFEAHNNLGVTLQLLGKFNEAEASFRQSILLNAEFAGSHNNLGSILEKLGRFNEAETSFRQSILLSAEYAGSHNNLGSILKKLGRFNEAEASFRQSILLNAKNAGFHNNLGNLLKEKGDLLEAINSFKTAINIQPNYAEAWNNIFFPLQAIKPQTSSIEKYTSSLIGQESSTYSKISESILSYRLNVGSSSINNYLDQTINIMSSDENLSIKNPQSPSKELITEYVETKKITILLPFGRSGTGLLHSLIDGHSNISSLPSIYFSEFFDHSTWNKIIAGGWKEMASNFTKIYEVLFDASSSIKIASKGMSFTHNIGQKEGMTNVGVSGGEVLLVDKNVFIKELNYLMDYHDSLDQIVFFKLVHFAYEKAINNHDKKNQIFYHIHNPDTYAQLNFLRLVPTASCLVMIREPLRSCESWISKDFNNNDYKTIVNKIFQMLFDVDQAIFLRTNSIGIKLEDLKMHPKKTISALCNWLGIKEEESLYQMTAQGKKWWGDPTSPDYKKSGMDPFDKSSINRKLGSIFSDNDQYILRTLYYPFRVRFGYDKKNVEQFKEDLQAIKPMLNKMFDFEKKISQSTNVHAEKFIKTGSYLYLRSGMIERWNTLNKFDTYPGMLKPLIINQF